MDDAQRGFDYAISLDGEADPSQFFYFTDVEIPDVSVVDQSSDLRGKGSLSDQTELSGMQGSLIARRGMGALEADLCIWIAKRIAAIPGPQLGPQTLAVHLLDAVGEVKVSWRVVDAVPVKWSKGFDFDKPEQILIESVDFTCGGMERIT